MFNALKFNSSFLVVLLFTVFCQAEWVENKTKNNKETFVPNEYVITFKNKSNLFQIKNLETRYKGNMTQVLPEKNIYLLKTNGAAPQSLNILENLKKNENIEIVEPNYLYSIETTVNDPDYEKQWGLKNSGKNDLQEIFGVTGVDINIEKAWDMTTGSSKVVVAVIDSGVDYEHADLKENIWTNLAEYNGTEGIDDDANGYIDDIHGYNFADENNTPLDDVGHGTHCAGIIGAKGNNDLGVSGVNWNVQIMPVKFISKGGGGTVVAAIKAIEYAVKNGAQIMSNSWGGSSSSETLKEAISEAEKKGVLFIAAAGNDSTNNDKSPRYPASYKLSNLIAVASNDSQGKLSKFSCYGPEDVHVAAPGSDIYSTIPHGKYAVKSGTSMAAPFISGVAALMLSINPNLKPEEIKQILIETSRPLSSLKGKIKAEGMVDAFAALNKSK